MQSHLNYLRCVPITTVKLSHMTVLIDILNAGVQMIIVYLLNCLKWRGLLPSTHDAILQKTVTFTIFFLAFLYVKFYRVQKRVLVNILFLSFLIMCICVSV